MPHRDDDVPSDAADPAAPGGGGRAPTIYDVARHAGVAASTVSRALARPGRVNAATAERVRAAARALGYRSTPVSGAPSRVTTKVIALSIADVTNPFYVEIIRGAQVAAGEADYTMMLVDGQESDAYERGALARALPMVEGVLMTSSRLTDTAIRTVAKQKATVVLNRVLSDVSSIVTDNHSGAQQAVALLAGLGHRSVAYVAGPEASWADGDRWRGLLAAAAEHGVHAKRHGPYPPTVDGGVQAGRDLLEQGPTAVVAYNDQMAIGVMQLLAARGVAVPGDVSVVGFDDIFAARLVTPPLTTVAAPLRQMGEIAVRNLLAVIGGARPSSGESLVVPTHLQERGSHGPAPRAPRRR